MIRRILLAALVLPFPVALATYGVLGSNASAAPPLPTATIATSTTIRPVATLPTTFVPVIITPPVTITFNDVASGTVVNSHYTNLGVTFSVVVGGPSGQPVASTQNVYATADPSAPAPTSTSCMSLWFTCPGGNFVTLNPPPQVAWFGGASGAVKATFASPKSWVSITARPSLLPGLPIIQPTNEPYLVANDASGNYLGQALYPYASTDPRWGTFQTLLFQAPAGKSIGSVLLSVQQQGGSSSVVVAEFDDLSFPK